MLLVANYMEVAVVCLHLSENNEKKNDLSRNESLLRDF